MLITIDTSNITSADRAILGLVLEGYDPAAMAPGRVEADEPAKPTRGRRTKLEIAFDDAKAVYEGPNMGDGREWAALLEARDALAAKDPDNPRVLEMAGEQAPVADEPTTAEMASDEAAALPSDISAEQVTELATQLIQKNREAMVKLLKQYVPEGSPMRVGNVPETELNAFADDMRTALA